jgi:hypothetical protein
VFGAFGKNPANDNAILGIYYREPCELWSALERRSGIRPHFGRQRAFEIVPKLPGRFEQLVILGIPQASAMQIAANFAGSGQQLPDPHTGDGIRQRTERLE